jgi:predicted peptidase
MRKLTLGLVMAVLSGMIGSAGAAETPKPSVAQKVEQFQGRRTEDLKAEYLLFLPKGYDVKAEKHWPLMLFLHGAGERGNDIWKVAVHGPPKQVAVNPDFPFILVSPQCPAGQIWSDDLVLGLLDDVTRRYAVDTNRVYLTGLSMGGYATWSLGLKHPERFAAIVPICGGGELITILLAEGDSAKALKTLGVWAFHGGKDPVVPVEESRRMVNALKHAGLTDVNLTVYPEAGHDSWTEAYKDPALYGWLLRHERKPGGGSL